ncbi:MAG TPA: hypothetical protein VMF52_02080 [Steroidobacteraceae bacterium]|nr:hypothetical protein [Steroidobacteraceae bacterium]
MSGAQNTTVTLHMPSSKVLAALGRVTIRHSLLDLVLTGTIKVLAELTATEAQQALEYEGARSKRELIKKLAIARFGKTSQATLKLAAILNSCGKLTDKRNRYVHSLWTTGKGEAAKLWDGGGHQKAPTATQLNQLADDIYQVARDLNEARLKGFIFDAMQNAKGTQAVKKAKRDEV